MPDRGGPDASGLFDCHLHIIDPRFPLVENQGYLPPAFTCDDYVARATPLGITGGAVVSGSFQAFDQAYLTDALARLGPDYVGVTQLPATVADQEILRLQAAGVRAVRFNLRRGGSAPFDELWALSQRVWDLAGWHVELYADAADLEPLLPRLAELPKLAVDHLGLSAAGMPTLLKLAERGVAVKATGFGRVDFDVRRALKDLVAANPESAMFGTDLPSTRATRPFSPADIDLIRDALDEDLAHKVLAGNARRFYRVAA